MSQSEYTNPLYTPPTVFQPYSPRAYGKMIEQRNTFKGVAPYKMSPYFNAPIDPYTLNQLTVLDYDHLHLYPMPAFAKRYGVGQHMPHLPFWETVPRCKDLIRRRQMLLGANKVKVPSIPGPSSGEVYVTGYTNP